MVGVNISHSNFHPRGAHITWVKIISHTGSSRLLLAFNILFVIRSIPQAFPFFSVLTALTISSSLIL